ncbi:hypothetical protein ACFYZB_00730 [Streptomyces sp. NPDC001852]
MAYGREFGGGCVLLPWLLHRFGVHETECRHTGRTTAAAHT